jgi:Rrf2 family protein
MAANSKFAVATHILTALAHISQGGPKGSRRDAGLVSSEVVAASVNTNPVVVRRIAAELAKAGLVISHQGKGGGLELSRSPEKITLQDVYEAMGEPAVFAFNPNKPNPRCPVSKRMVEVLKPVFAQAQAGVRDRLGKIRLSDLLKEIG